MQIALGLTETVGCRRSKSTCSYWGQRDWVSLRWMRSGDGRKEHMRQSHKHTDRCWEAHFNTHIKWGKKRQVLTSFHLVGPNVLFPPFLSHQCRLLWKTSEHCWGNQFSVRSDVEMVRESDINTRCSSIMFEHMISRLILHRLVRQSSVTSATSFETASRGRNSPVDDMPNNSDEVT